jgi:hypothetical protein
MTQDELNQALAASPSPDRVTPEYLRSRIANQTFTHIGLLTICVLTLDNGFMVTGESACADPANYRADIGEKIAYDMAERKIWPLLGFALKEAMAARKAVRGEDAVEFAARSAHEVNRAYCLALGDTSQVPWHEAPANIQESARDGVRYVLEHPDSTPADQHANWLEFKQRDGWKWGPVKDAERKTHPCFVRYDDLPEAQRAKDALFGIVVRLSLGLA